LKSQACAVLTVGGGQMQQVWPVGGQQRIGAKVRPKAAGGQDHRAELLKNHPARVFFGLSLGCKEPEWWFIAHWGIFDGVTFVPTEMHPQVGK